MPAIPDLERLRTLLVDLRRDAARRGTGADADIVKWATEVETVQQLIEALDRSIEDERRSARCSRPMQELVTAPGRVPSARRR